MNKHQIEKQCSRVETALRACKCHGRITGGHAGPLVTMLTFTPAAHIRMSTVYQNYDAITAALGAPDIKISRGQMGINITFENADVNTIKVRFEEVGA